MTVRRGPGRGGTTMTWTNDTRSRTPMRSEVGVRPESAGILIEICPIARTMEPRRVVTTRDAGPLDSHDRALERGVGLIENKSRRKGQIHERDREESGHLSW